MRTVEQIDAAYDRMTADGPTMEETLDQALINYEQSLRNYPDCRSSGHWKNVIEALREKIARETVN